MRRFRRCVVVWILLFGVVASFTLSAAAEPETPAGPAELRAILRLAANNDIDTAAVQYLEEQTNTRLAIEFVAGSELDRKVSLMLASGERPDIINIMGTSYEIDYVSNGLLLPLNDYFDQAPNLASWRTETAWNSLRHPDGNIYAAGIRTPKVHFALLYREGWLEKLNLSVPTTIEEYLTVAEAVTNDDPDGNGRNDTYAFGSANLGASVDWRMWDGIFASFGSLPHYWMLVDGELDNGSIRPETKEALRFLNRMYTEGLIDPEFVTDDQTRWTEKYRAGIYGAQTAYVYIADTENIWGHYGVFRERNPDDEYIAGPLLEGASENPLGLRAESQRGWIRYAIAKESEEIDAALRVFDWLASDEGTLFMQYGSEGEHYSIENGVIAQLVPTETLTELGCRQLELIRTAPYSHTSLKLQDIMASSAANGYYSPVDGIVLPAEIAQYEVLLNEYTTTEFYKMIIGDSPIDTAFDRFVTEWKSRGGDELAEAYNAAYTERANAAAE